MLKHKYKLVALLICLIFFSLALFSSVGFDPVRNLADYFLCIIKVDSACYRISNGVNWKNLKYSGNGILADEIPHISGGYYYLKTHRYFINPEHPPLVKDIAGLGIMLFSNPRPAFPNITEQVDLPLDYQFPSYPFEHTNFPKIIEWQNNQIHFGKLYLFHPLNDPDEIAFHARLAVILVNTFLLYWLFHLLTKIWSERAALLALFFFAVSQFSIAHGSFVVIDFMSAVLTVIAIIYFAIYLKNYIEEKSTTRYFFLTSLFFALALLSKFSSIVLLPAAFLGGLIFAILMEIRSPRSKGDRISVVIKYIFSYAAIVILALFIISVFYFFHTYKMENEMLVQKIYENYPEEQLPAVGHEILKQMIYLNPLTKGLAEYINGSFMVVSRMMTSTQNTYFLGNVYGSEGAGGWYFPVLYATKLSLGLHFFSLLILGAIIYGFFKSKKTLKQKFFAFISNPLSLLLIVFAYFYMVITLSSNFQIGLRHIMPVILAICLLTGKGVDKFWNHGFLRSNLKNIKIKHIFAVVAVLMFFSVFWSFPYYLEYYNILGGGTDSGYKIATDSNYDWGGSDVRRLAKWVRDNGVSEIYTHIFNDTPLRYYLGEGEKGFNINDGGKLPPSGSYIAVSVFEYMANVHCNWTPPEEKYSILDPYLVARVGKTIFVYQVP